MPRKKHVLKKYFLAHGISQGALAERLGVSQASISVWLSGKFPFPEAMEARAWEYANAIARRAGELFSAEEQMRLTPRPAPLDEGVSNG